MHLERRAVLLLGIAFTDPRVCVVKMHAQNNRLVVNGRQIRLASEGVNVEREITYKAPQEVRLIYT